MHELFELKEKLLKELGEYSQQELTAGNLQVVDTLSHAIKNICKIIEAAEMEEYSGRGGQGSYRYEGGSSNRYEGGSSNRYARDGGGSSNRNASYASYARGRTGNVRRDSMGRYSRNDGIEELVENVRDMMQELPPNVQQDAQKFVQKLEQQM